MTAITEMYQTEGHEFFEGGVGHDRKENTEHGRDEYSIRRTECIQLLRETAVLQLRVR